MTIDEYIELPNKPYWKFLVHNWDVDIAVTIYEDTRIVFDLGDRWMEILADDLIEIGRRAKLFRDRRVVVRQKELEDYDKGVKS